MKIIHICLSGLYMDGWGYQDNMLAKYHKKSGHDVSVIANRYIYDEKGNYINISDDLFDSTDCNGVRIIRLEQVGNKMLKGPAERVHYKRLYETLVSENPDIIFLHNPQILDTDQIAKYVKENPSVSLYVDSHSDYSNSARNFLSKHILHGILWRSKIKKLIPYTKKFYGVLPARVDFLLERYKTPKNKTELLCMGMDTELAVKADNPATISDVREKLGISPDDFLIISGGKIDHAKRQTLLLLEAMANINNPHIKLIVFGSVVDDMKDEFNQLLEKASSNTTFIGWLDANDTYPYFASSDLAIFPGRHSVMWEQVAGQGIPMICKYWEGTTHVDVGGNVKFLHNDSADEIKTLIENLSDKNETYQEMKKAAKQNGPKNFSYEEIAAKCII